ncbi:MAG: Mor transcription activator family protein [Clostridia bacterium]|nr:Mor transcription activator family protein [Clostridia bacterium]
MDPSEIDESCLNEIYSDIADLLGVDAALKFYGNFRGQQITFPVKFFTKEFIEAQITKEYDGHNIKQLATKFGYSEKWIRKIIKEKTRKEE